MPPLGLLTLGTATYDDFDGVYFTLKSLQLYHKHVFESSEIVVVDNNPKGIHASSLERYLNEMNYLGNVKLFKLEHPVGTAPAKQHVINMASNPWVVVFDCHVLFEQGSFDALLREILKGGHERDILSGPLVNTKGDNVSTHYEWKWRGQTLGIWGTSKHAMDPDSPAVEIPGTGTGAFAVNKNYFPGFHPAFRGFGSEELYIHEKVRLHGGAAYCIPGFRWHHRFYRIHGVPYPHLLWDKVRNYVIGFQELGLPIDEIHDYYVHGGFMSQREWDILIQDPIGNERPPLLMEVAQDAPERTRILKNKFGNSNEIPVGADMRNAIPAQYQAVAQNGGSVGALHEKNMRERIASIPDTELSRIPIPDNVQAEINKLPESERPKAIRAYREGFLFSQWKQAVENTPVGGTVEPGKPGCCGGKGEVQKPQFRENVVSALKDTRSIRELEQKEMPLEVDPEHQKRMLQYLKGAKRILEIGDDPIGGTSFLLRSMEDDAILVSLYEDQKFLPEINELGRLAAEEGKALKLSVGTLDDLDIRGTTFDFAFLNPPVVDAEYTYKMLQKILPHVDGVVALHKSDKYWAFTADKRPGMLPGVAKFLNEEDNTKWSVIQKYREGLGMMFLSNRPEHKPKLPSTAKIAATFMQAVAKHIATGAKEVTKEELEYRLLQCSVCEHRVDNRCSLCGCFITSNVLSKGKAFWKDQHCPIGKWQHAEAVA